MTECNLIGIKNFVCLELEKLLKNVNDINIEERVKEGLLHNDIDKITQLTYGKILDKLSNSLADKFIERLKEKENKL